MWDMRRNLDPRPMPNRKSVIRILFRDQPPACRRWWLIVSPEEGVDLCSTDPGFDVDLYVNCDLRCLTAIWVGLSNVSSETESGALELIGDSRLTASMQSWLGLSPFAPEPKRV